MAEHVYIGDFLGYYGSTGHTVLVYILHITWEIKAFGCAVQRELSFRPYIIMYVRQNFNL